MTALVSAGNTNGPRLCFVNSGPSSVITNTTTETVFDQVFTYPDQSHRYTLPTTVVRVEAFGVMSTGLLNLGLTLRLRWGGISGSVIATTGAVTLTSSLSNEGWFFKGVCMIDSTGGSGTLEAQGFGSFGSTLTGALSDHSSNTSTFTIDTINAQDIVLTAQWATATANNQIQIRTITVDVDGP